MKSTRSDLVSFSTVYRDTGVALKEAGSAIWQAALMLALIPVHAALWLWLPELSPQEHERREKSRRAIADADW